MVSGSSTLELTCLLFSSPFEFHLFLFPLAFTSHPSARVLLQISLAVLLEFWELAEINMYYTHTFILFFSWQCVKFILLSLAKFEGHSHIVKSIIRCFLMPSNCWESFFSLFRCTVNTYKLIALVYTYVLWMICFREIGIHLKIDGVSLVFFLF